MNKTLTLIFLFLCTQGGFAQESNSVTIAAESRSGYVNSETCRSLISATEGKLFILKNMLYAEAKSVAATTCLNMNAIIDSESIKYKLIYHRDLCKVEVNLNCDLSKRL